jgi:hypothetical protein
MLGSKAPGATFTSRRHNILLAMVEQNISCARSSSNHWRAPSAGPKTYQRTTPGTPNISPSRKNCFTPAPLCRPRGRAALLAPLSGYGDELGSVTHVTLLSSCGCSQRRDRSCSASPPASRHYRLMRALWVLHVTRRSQKPAIDWLRGPHASGQLNGMATRIHSYAAAAVGSREAAAPGTARHLARTDPAIQSVFVWKRSEARGLAIPLTTDKGEVCREARERGI